VFVNFFSFLDRNYLSTRDMLMLYKYFFRPDQISKNLERVTLSICPLLHEMYHEVTVDGSFAYVPGT
jgi:hypothetical protein